MAAIIALIGGFVVATIAPASVMSSLISLLAAAVVYFVSLKFLYRRIANDTQGKNLGPIVQGNLPETPFDSPVH